MAGQVHRYQHAAGFWLVANDHEVRGVAALLEWHDPLPRVISRKLDHDGRERLHVVGGGHAQVEVLQSLAGQGIGESENLRSLGQRAAHHKALDARTCSQREDRLRHLKGQERGLGVWTELKRVGVQVQQVVLRQGDVGGQRESKDVQGAGEAHGATRWRSVSSTQRNLGLRKMQGGCGCNWQPSHAISAATPR
jgi:hypothetical protein